MARELCMSCFSVKKQHLDVCPFCGYKENTPPEQPHFLTPGTLLGNRYVVGVSIGSGGFGITYKCYDSVLGMIVAIKEFFPIGLVNRAPGESNVGILSGKKESQYKEQLGRFMMEAQSVAAFGKAQDIVNVFDFFEANHTAYIVMEYADGVLLKDYLEKQGAMTQTMAMTLIMPILEATAKVHGKGIIHRDISPDNIFIMNEKSIKIFDFGAAILNNTKEGRAAETVIKVGYSAPEQYRENSRQTFSTDVYSIGAILYQMITGEKPLESTEREFKDTLQSPVELGYQIDSYLDKVIMQALAVNPDFRFVDVHEFIEALQRKIPAEYPKERIKQIKRKRNLVLLGAGAAVACMGLVIGLFNYKQNTNPMFSHPIKDEITVEVWVESQVQKSQIDKIVKNGFVKSEESSDNSNKSIEKVQKEDKKVTVNVKTVSDMEKELEKALEDDALPDMFIADNVDDLEKYPLISLEDNVYASLNLDNYLFLSDYKTMFPDAKQMPVSLETVMTYAMDVDYNKNNTIERAKLDSSYINQYNDDEPLENTLSVKTFLDDANQEENNIYSFASTGEVDLLLMTDQDWLSVIRGKEEPTDGMLHTLVKIRELASRDVSNYRLNQDQEGNSMLKGNTLLANASYRIWLNKAIDKKDDGVVNTLKNYKPFLMKTEDGKSLVKLREKFSIVDNKSEEKMVACERLLWFMLNSGIGQKRLAVSQGGSAYPIEKEKFHEFQSYNSSFGTFSQCVESYQNVILIGQESADIRHFADGLKKIPADKKQLKEYCKQYVKERQDEK